MTAPTDVGTDVDLETLVQMLDEEDPRCEFSSECPIHGTEPCGHRARWVATLRCRDQSDCEPHQVLACDPCHDDILDGGNETVDSIVVDWRPL